MAVVAGKTRAELKMKAHTLGCEAQTLSSASGRVPCCCFLMGHTMPRVSADVVKQ